MELKFKIGDEMWWARYHAVERARTCPDCAGQKFVTVAYGDGTQARVSCAGCALGYEPSRGYVTYHEYVPQAERRTVTGYEARDGKVTYWDGSQGCSEVFATDAEAMDRAIQIGAEKSEEERRRAETKKDPNRTWAWHVHYHRKEIRRLEEQIEHHRKHYAVAKDRSREPSSREEESK